MRRKGLIVVWTIPAAHHRKRRGHFVKFDISHIQQPANDCRQARLLTHKLHRCGETAFLHSMLFATAAQSPDQYISLPYPSSILYPSQNVIFGRIELDITDSATISISLSIEAFRIATLILVPLLSECPRRRLGCSVITASRLFSTCHIRVYAFVLVSAI
ncbi:hypothetical protein K458DRAFT_81299 [Lentithecium fluviatile CBS 122367]|uniref:Uncharacterized protein n=1 Tax=Lentithecium fluviatile CBS 122367 TaxID=1168545 RepID=A0A6G1IUE0_9PLEO|nr:hypothetical protein K458DRAFT_81299 [Lentithecium fluviatile CBS 122367]